jgi:Gas vesicle protein
VDQYRPFENKELTLLDLLDGVIDTGVVVRGEIVISIANIDLIIVDLKLLVASIEKAYGSKEENVNREDLLDGTFAARYQ